MATFAFQRTTRAKQHWAAATQDSGLHTRHMASQQTIPQICRLQIIDSHSGMRFSETVRDVKHRWWTVVINRMTYYISQGRVETPIRRGRQLCCSSVANLLQYVFQKLSKCNTVWQSYCKNKRVHFFAPQCRITDYQVIILFDDILSCFHRISTCDRRPHRRRYLVIIIIIIIIINRYFKTHK